MIREDSLIFQVLLAPVTSSNVLLCLIIWLYLNIKKIDYSQVGYSYSKVIKEKQYWRIITSSLSHFNILHIFFNMSSLWSCRIVEIYFGSLFFIKYSLLLMISSMLLISLVYHILIHYWHKEEYNDSLSVGYSCVVFGWMTFLSQVSTIQYLQIFGISFPINLAPFGVLIFTSILIRNSSFIGHLSGIFVGYFIAYSEFFQLYWYSTYMFFSLLLWTIIIFCASLKVTTNFPIPFIQFPHEIEPHVYLRDGVIIRETNNDIIEV